MKINNPTIYIFMNKSLGMSAGKLAAQAAHAAALVDTRSNWLDNAHRTILVMQARDEAHIRSIKEYIGDRGFNSHIIIDEGVNEIDPHTVTALATDIVDRLDGHTQATFSTFELYSDTIRLSIEVDR